LFLRRLLGAPSALPHSARLDCYQKSQFWSILFSPFVSTFTSSLRCHVEPNDRIPFTFAAPVQLPFGTRPPSEPNSTDSVPLSDVHQPWLTVGTLPHLGRLPTKTVLSTFCEPSQSSMQSVRAARRRSADRMNSRTPSGRPRSGRTVPRSYPGFGPSDALIGSSSMDDSERDDRTCCVMIIPHQVSRCCDRTIVPLSYACFQGQYLSGRSPPNGYIFEHKQWDTFVDRLSQLHLIITYTFGSDPSNNQSDLSSEVNDHLKSHGYAVPARAEDTQDNRFSLCKYKNQKSKDRYRGSQEHTINRDSKATSDEWTYRSLLHRHPKLRHQDLPVVIIGLCLHLFQHMFLTSSSSQIWQHHWPNHRVIRRGRPRSDSCS
jgi:hypothetical protein